MSSSHSAPLTQTVGELPPNIIAKIDVVPGLCWIWTGKPNGWGYGVAYVGRRMQLAHRGVWQFLVGQIPEGLDLDHVCRVRMCVNPDHLEPVTRSVNVARGAHWAGIAMRHNHCRRGHNDWADNGPGKRVCRVCRKNRRNAREEGLL